MRIQRCALPCALALLALVSCPAAAKERGQVPMRLQNEVPDDPYVASPRLEHPRSPATRFSRESFVAVQVNVDALGQNIVGDAANEPSIAVDPTDPNRMVIGWRQFDTVASNFRQAGYAYTTDGGQTWTFPGVIEPGIFRSDPVLDSNSAGELFYNSLTVEGSDYLCDVFRTAEAGMPWDSGTPAQGGDKQWMVIDKTGGAGDGHIYAFWTNVFSSCYPGFFTRSTNGGDSFASCTEIPDDPYWGSLAVAPGAGLNPSGALYVVGVHDNDFVVVRSSNAPYGGQAIVWDLSTVVQLGGYADSYAGPNPGGLLGQAGIATIPSAAPLGYTVCVLCSVNPPGSDPLDVMFTRSNDGGATWSTPVRVNDDSGNAWQWFGTMSTSPSGRIDVVWLDTRDNPGTYLSSLYYSYSTDGGVTWSANERLSEAFNPEIGWPDQNKMGDYFQMVSDDTGFRLAWAATFNGEEDVYFGRKILGATAAGETQPAPVSLLVADPNPFNPRTTVRYAVDRTGPVTLRAFDLRGRLVRSLVVAPQDAGEHTVDWDGRDDSGRNLASGTYLVQLKTAGGVRAVRVSLVR